MSQNSIYISKRNTDFESWISGPLAPEAKIDRTDTFFQTFARLSLLNDSDMLLERLMCILPENENPAQHWSSVRRFWSQCLEHLPYNPGRWCL